MKTTVIYHSADFDGLFCREIARKFLGEKDVEYIGWNFGDPPIPLAEGQIYILDLPVDRVFGWTWGQGAAPDPDVWVGLIARIIWIDHHASSIASHPTNIPGYRIDGVAACRLAWQWFARECHIYPMNSGPDNRQLPTKQDFIDRKFYEPLAVRLAGEYDIWDKRDPNADTFQYALRAQDKIPWVLLLERSARGTEITHEILADGQAVQRYQQKIDADLVTNRSYRLNWEGLKWIVLNTGRFNSLTFAALDKPETGHDALLGYMFNGKVWTVSLYQAKHRTDLDLCAIAVKYGGGGHRGACGFTCSTLPIL